WPRSSSPSCRARWLNWPRASGSSGSRGSWNSRPWTSPAGISRAERCSSRKNVTNGTISHWSGGSARFGPDPPDLHLDSPRHAFYPAGRLPDSCSTWDCFQSVNGRGAPDRDQGLTLASSNPVGRMTRRWWTLLIVYDDPTDVRQFRISRELVRITVGSALVLVSVLTSLAAGFFVKESQRLQVQRLQRENKLLEAEIGE